MDMGKSERSLNQNYIKIESILSRAAQTLRLVFRNRWKQVSGSDWIDTPEYGSKLLAKIRRTGFEISGKAQIDCVSSGVVENWDLTILTSILLNFEKSSRTSEEQEHLRKLKQVRNNFAHHSSKAVSDEEFKSLWNDAESALFFFGDTKTGIRSFSAAFLASILTESAPEINKPNTKKAMKLKEQANKCYSDGKFKDAVKLYNEAIMLSGLSEAVMAILYSNRSAAYLKQSVSIQDKSVKSSILQKALSDGKAAVKHNPNWFKGFLCLGKIYMELDKHDKALKNYDSALALEPLRSEIKAARDACALTARAEHFNPFNNQTVTREEQLKKFNEQTGLNIRLPKDVDEKLSARIPGYADVQKAHSYRLGVEDGVFQNYELAAQLYAKAAGVGNVAGITNLGQMYMLGQGMKQDAKMAVKLYREAAAKPVDVYIGAREEIAVAEHSLGFAFSEGIGVPKDDCQAVFWFTRASENGFSSATHNLATHYALGRGVLRDQDKAVQYWKAAASKKNPLSMEALALHYLGTENDAAEARKWYKRAIQNGNYSAKLREPEFEKEAKKVEEKQSEFLKEVQTWEQDNKLECTGMTFRERMIRFMNHKNSHDSEMLKLVDNLMNISSKGQTSTPGTASTFDKQRFDTDMLQRYAARGSLTARRMLDALGHYEEALGSLLLGMNLPSAECYIPHQEMLYHLAEAYKLEALVVLMPVDLQPKLNEIIKKCLDLAKSTGDKDLDLDARICYAHLNMNSVQHILDFMTPCMKIYPNEEVFHVIAAHLYAFLGRYEEGARTTSKSLEKFPTNHTLLFAKASHLRLNSNNQQLIINAFEEYLTHAPIDDRSRPDAIYAIGFAYHNMSNKKAKPGGTVPPNIAKAREYYQKGLEAEKQQLPCFIPCKAVNKGVLENFLKLDEWQFKKVASEESKSTIGQATQITKEIQAVNLNVKRVPNLDILTDLNRVTAIVTFRGFLQKYAAFPAFVAKLSAPPKHRHRRPESLEGLTKITLNDMDPTTDHVYANSVIHFTCIEPALIGGASIGVLFQDSNMSVIRGSIYNFHTDDRVQIQKALGVGATMAIINPYMRQAMDGGFGIRVDDPQCLKLVSPSRENYCRFCGEEANAKCVRCGKAWYCSKECQANDWKIMKHKLICAK